MNEQLTTPAEKPMLKGVELWNALLEKKRFINKHLSNGGTISELENIGFKFGKIDLKNIAMEEQTVSTTEVAEHKGIALFKKAQAKKKLISEHLAKGGTVEELRQMGFKFGKLDLHNLTQ